VSITNRRREQLRRAQQAHRARRRAKGMKLWRVWVTPAEAVHLETALNTLRQANRDKGARRAAMLKKVQRLQGRL
jgi:hypothetical protein